MEHSCCIAGHRQIPRGWGAEIERRLRAAVEDLLAQGVYRYVQGLTSEFDVLSAKTLIAMKAEHPELVLQILLPSRDYTDRWTPQLREECEKILTQCDSCEYLFPSLRRGDLHKYNSEMVNRCRYCLCRLTRISGNTSEMVRYARRTGRVVINISERNRVGVEDWENGPAM